MSVERRRSRKRFWVPALSLLGLVPLAGAGVFGIGWYFSGQLLDAVHVQPTYDLRVLSLHGHTIAISRTTTSARNGTFGLDWLGGRAVLGRVISRSSDGVVRRITGDLAGLHAGTRVDLDVAVYASPRDLHLRYKTVYARGPLGRMPGWFIPASGRTWAVMVHGYKATRADVLRPIPTLHALGLPVLDITYRNDAGAPWSPDHLYHLSATEWQDLQAWVQYALTHGARSVVLYGFSYGGGIVESFLHHSGLAPKAHAVVLDAPALDWSSILELHGAQKSLPGFIIAAGKQVIAWRLGFANLDTVNWVKQAGSLRMPTLLFHDAQDDQVPIAGSIALARARPDLVTFVKVAGAGHTQEWNVARRLYTQKLKSFLERALG